MQDGCVRIAAIVVAFALAAVALRGRRSALVRGALALALACDVAANVERSHSAVLDVAIVTTFVAALALIVDVATTRGRFTTREGPAGRRASAREDAPSFAPGSDDAVTSRSSDCVVVW